MPGSLRAAGPLILVHEKHEKHECGCPAPECGFKPFVLFVLFVDHLLRR
jgi:hypothetical protein